MPPIPGGGQPQAWGEGMPPMPHVSNMPPPPPEPAAPITDGKNY